MDVMEKRLLDRTLTCSLPELFTLAAFLTGEVIIGVPDPFSGWLVEEIEEAVEQAYHTLAERQYLRIQPDGTLFIDTDVALLVGTVTHPQVLFMVTDMPADGRGQRVNYYHRSPVTVALTIEEEQVLLKALPTETLTDAVLRVWQMQEQNPAPAAPFSIPEDALRQAKEALPAREKARQILQNAKVPSDHAEALVDALAHPKRTATLAAIRSHPNRWEAQGMVALEGPKGLWLLRSFSRNQIPWVECIPCSAAKMQEEVQSLIQRMLPYEEK